MKIRNRKNYLKARKKQFKWTQFGYIATDYACPNCGADTMVFFDKYDAWACMSCLEWAEPACGDPRCPFCRIRPDNPYEAYHLNDTEAMSAEQRKRWRRDNYQHKTNGMHKHNTRRQRYETWKVLAYLLSCVMLLSLLATSPNMAVSAKDVFTGASTQNSIDKKACWISFLDIEVLLQDKNENDFRAKVSAMYDNVVKYGMNTVIVHVRALGDAMYPSDYYPWAAYFVTDRSDPGYDPLQIMINLAHGKNLQFEAWINPYRLSRDSKSTASFKATPYYEQFRPFTIEYKASGSQTCLALDPARPETIDLITDGVKEIVSRYDVDGIHFDDYFYVPGMADQLDLPSKKANVNTLVSQVYTAIKSIKPDCTFGISPAGNPDNARNQGADIDTWLSAQGYIDYIMPQIYWTDVYITKDGPKRMFTERCSAWQKINKLDVPMYVGLALYQVGTSSKTDLGWASSDTNLAYQFLTAKQLGYDGYALFRYQWLERDIAAVELNHLKDY